MNNATIINNNKPTIALDVLTTKGMRLREGTNGKTVTQYCERYREGADLEPITVFVDHAAGHTYLADGHHRVAAAKRAGFTALPVIIYEGTRRDALLFAAAANAKHGLPLTNDDKRNIVDTVLLDDEWRSWSDRAIAEKIHVSPQLVGARRKKLPKELQVNERKGKDGRVKNTGNIGKIKKETPAEIANAPEPEVIKLDDEPEQITAPKGKEKLRVSDSVKLPPSITNDVPSSLETDQSRQLKIIKKARAVLAETLRTGKHQWTGTDRQLVSLALVVGVPVSADDEAWNDTLPPRAFTVLADRLKSEVADRLTSPDAYRLPPAEMLAHWWSIDMRAATMTAERFL